MKILFLVLFRPPDTETQRMVTMVTMVTMTMSATTLTRSRWCRATDRGTEGGDDGVDGDDDVVGDDADEITMVQNYRQSRTRSTDPVSDQPAHTSCLLVGPPLLF